MSYILEALRKSQKDREIGQVPTLATQPLFTSQESGGNFRGLAAVALAGLAVAIALYAALRGVPEAIPPASTSVPALTQTTGPAPIGAPAAAPTPGATPALAGIHPSPAAAGTAPMAAPGMAPVPSAPPAVSARLAPPTPPPAPSSVPSDEELTKVPFDESDDAPKATNDRSSVAPGPKDGIPDDLRQDIQSFKEQLKGGESGKGGKKAKNEKLVPPQERHLPREVEERLPSFLLTVHIYDVEPAKRFVVIDGRKMRQGDSTRSGILVEEILPDGVALSFEGHKFFRPR